MSLPALELCPLSLLLECTVHSTSCLSVAVSVVINTDCAERERGLEQSVSKEVSPANLPHLQNQVSRNAAEEEAETISEPKGTGDTKETKPSESA